MAATNVLHADTKSVRFEDGREIVYCEYGDPHGRPVFYFHGTPGSRLEPALTHEAGIKHAYRLIAPDRPGVGGSSTIRKRGLLDWPLDVLRIADNLGLDTFGVIGASGGGPYALACTYAIGERLTFAAVLGSWAPLNESALWDELAPVDRFFGRLSGSARLVFYLPFALLGLSAKYMSPKVFMNSLSSSMCEADRQQVADHRLAEYYTEDVRESFRQGVKGPADDAIILYADWGFNLGEISMPVHIFHGEEDKFAPYAFAEYLHQEIPNSVLHSYPGEGHYYMMNIIGQVFEAVESE